MGDKAPIKMTCPGDRRPGPDDMKQSPTMATKSSSITTALAN